MDAPTREEPLTAAPPPGFPTRVANRLGRRGTVLVCIGTIWCLFGWSVLGVDTDRFSRPGPSPLDWLDSPLWGWVWIAGGVVAWGTAWIPRLRNGSVGYNALTVPALVWAFAYAWSFLVHTATGGVYGEPRALPALIVWSAVVVMLVVINGWEEQPDPPNPFTRRQAGRG